MPPTLSQESSTSTRPASRSKTRPTFDAIRKRLSRYPHGHQADRLVRVLKEAAREGKASMDMAAHELLEEVMIAGDAAPVVGTTHHFLNQVLPEGYTYLHTSEEHCLIKVVRS